MEGENDLGIDIAHVVRVEGAGNACDSRTQAEGNVLEKVVLIPRDSAAS